MAKGEGHGPRALTVSQGGQRLAFIGPLDSTVSVLDAESLDEVSKGVYDAYPLDFRATRIVHCMYM